MKKLVRIVSVLLLVATMIFSQTACNIVFNSNKNSGGTLIEGDVGDNGNKGNNGDGTGSVGGEDSSIRDSSDAKDIDKIQVQNVTFNVISDRQKMEMTDVIKKVEKSIVVIKMADGVGSGVIIDMKIQGETGNFIYVLTCNHVIGTKGDVKVLLPNEKCEYDGFGDDSVNDYTFSGTIGGQFSENVNKAVTLVGGDLKSDVALLKIDLSKPTDAGTTIAQTKITKSCIANNDYQVQKGEEVVAIGNPTGKYPGWASCGNVALLELETDIPDIGEMKLMGIDVDTNQGNSGGGLFNRYGELIAMTNAGNVPASDPLSGIRHFVGINFAIPLFTSLKGVENEIDNGIVNVVTELAGTCTSDNYGFVTGRKAIFGYTVTYEEIDGKDCCYISSVQEGSLAEEYGLGVNFRIYSISINGENKPFETYDDLIAILNSTKVGDRIKYGFDGTIQKTTRGVKVVPFSTLQEREIVVKQYHFCNTGV